MPEPEVGMTADLEFKGRNVDKAVERAAKTLQVPVEDLHYEVLSHGSSGIFGTPGPWRTRSLPKRAVTIVWLRG
mgnify:CR=1 FL=1